MRQGRRKCLLSTGLGTPQAPRPHRCHPSGPRLGARLQPRSAPGFVSSTSPCENRHHLFGGAGGAESPGRARWARAGLGWAAGLGPCPLCPPRKAHTHGR